LEPFLFFEVCNVISVVLLVGLLFCGALVTGIRKYVEIGNGSALKMETGMQ
jgi:hypothetical protein